MRLVVFFLYCKLPLLAVLAVGFRLFSSIEFAEVCLFKLQSNTTVLLLFEVNYHPITKLTRTELVA